MRRLTYIVTHKNDDGEILDVTEVEARSPIHAVMRLVKVLADEIAKAGFVPADLAFETIEGFMEVHLNGELLLVEHEIAFSLVEKFENVVIIGNGGREIVGTLGFEVFGGDEACADVSFEFDEALDEELDELGMYDAATADKIAKKLSALIGEAVVLRYRESGAQAPGFRAFERC